VSIDGSMKSSGASMEVLAHAEPVESGKHSVERGTKEAISPLGLSRATLAISNGHLREPGIIKELTRRVRIQEMWDGQSHGRWH
jgi:hypothetical protein